ncbi:hypothetical protein LS73_009230 [Helicobacter muridarum]|uniref:Uncharacterized protein n=1 Tax=Helicobacter muridarum TaxID=216 RepID=A0A4V6I311_9HELI|nr:hypothetical protein LS73_009230 [Helicobacter muridarum]
MQAYKSGVIHEVCDKNLQTQLWNFNLFDNQAVQIQNVGTKTCLQTPTFRHTIYYSAYLTQCAINKSNLDQQWYIIPTLVNTAPIFTINRE